MRVYEISIEESERPTYAATMADVKAVLRDCRAAIYWPDVRVYECECQNDKAGLVHALNHLPVLVRLRAWRGTSRGGLKECGLDI